MPSLAERREILRNAFRQMIHYSSRSEDFADHIRLFVDPAMLDRVVAKENQLILGSRGTGKSALLDAAVTTLTNEIKTKRILAVKVAATDLRNSPSTLPGLDKYRSRSLGAFERTIDLVIQALLRFEVRVREDHALYPEFSHITLQDAADKLVALLEQTGNQWTLWSLKQTAYPEDLSLNDIDSRIHDSIGIVRKSLTEVLAALNLEALYLFIDEWTEIEDQTGAYDIQSDFADLLRRCMGRSPHFAVKIFASPDDVFVGGFRDGILMGYEPNQDITTLPHLDWPLLSQSEIRAFFARLLYLRLVYANRDVQTWADRKDVTTPADGFIEELFSDSAAFDELIRSADRQPRAFVDIVKIMSSDKSIEFGRTKIRHSHVASAMNKNRNSIPLRLAERQKDQVLLLDFIRPLIQLTGRHVFLIRKSQMTDSLARELLVLLRSGQLRRYSSATLPAELVDDYEAFVVQYSEFRWWEEQRLRRSASGERSLIPEWLFPPPPMAEEDVFDPSGFLDRLGGRQSEIREPVHLEPAPSPADPVPVRRSMWARAIGKISRQSGRFPSPPEP